MTFLHTNDVHARYEQYNKYGSSCTESDASQGQCFGGYARLAAAIKSLRAQNPDSLLLDGGDQYQGTLYFYKYGGNITSHFMNWVGYDVMTIGNHEFDREIEGLVSFLKAVNFSVVSANIDTSLEPDVTGLFRKSVVRTVAGRSVGIIGYTTEDTPFITSSGKLVFNSVTDSVTAEVQRLLRSGTEIIIAVGHAGFTVDKQVANIPGVDIVIGGHSNTFLYTGDPPSQEVPLGDYPHVVTRDDGTRGLVVQCYTMGKYLCVLSVTFSDAGDVIAYSGSPMLMNASVEQDLETMAELAPWKQGVANMTDTVVGRTLVNLEGDFTVCRARECNLGNVVADSMVFQNLRHPDELHWNDVSIALANGGAVRSSIGKGEITIADVISVLPFGNTIDAITLKGRHLRAALEHSVARLDPCLTENLFGGFLQVSGMRVRYNLTNPVGQRVVSVEVLCTKCHVPEFTTLDPDETYKLIVSSFIAKGGDGYSVIRDNLIEHHLLGDLDSDVLTEYVKAVSPIYKGIEGRIEFVDNSDVCDPISASVSHRPFRQLFLSVCLVSMYFR
ncbi:hypothetical protein V1264_016316 [Littorina saxatilis]|uniref:5'-nucleotidase n=1 Tax=Littorina saxatilis TaxID=31220 RepID=A0AAN9BNR9_9CAEN